MTSIRKKDTEEAYQKLREERRRVGIVGFAYNLDEEEIISVYTHWAIIPNQFPYDMIAEVHHMLVPKRVFGRLEEATNEEMNELYSIKKEIQDKYNYILETLGGMQSNTKHLHLQLIKLKENPCDCT